MRLPHPLTEKIMKLHGKKSYGLIAKELGITRNVVAGVISGIVGPLNYVGQ